MYFFCSLMERSLHSAEVRAIQTYISLKMDAIQQVHHFFKLERKSLLCNRKYVELIFLQQDNNVHIHVATSLDLNKRGTWFCQFVDNSILILKIIVSVTEKQRVYVFHSYIYKRERVKIICSLSSILINLNSSHSNIKMAWISIEIHGGQTETVYISFFLNECSKILIIQLRLPHRNIACLRIIAYA